MHNCLGSKFRVMRMFRIQRLCTSGCVFGKHTSCPGNLTDLELRLVGHRLTFMSDGVQMLQLCCCRYET